MPRRPWSMALAVLLLAGAQAAWVLVAPPLHPLLPQRTVCRLPCRPDDVHRYDDMDAVQPQAHHPERHRTRCQQANCAGARGNLN